MVGFELYLDFSGSDPYIRTTMKHQPCRETFYINDNEVAMHSRIEVNPQVCHGKPVIRGTRIMVRNILGSLAGGDSIPEILQNYPELTYEDIEAAIAYAIELVDDTQVTLMAPA